jgi:hypothetical protein
MILMHACSTLAVATLLVDPQLDFSGLVYPIGITQPTTSSLLLWSRLLVSQKLTPVGAAEVSHVVVWVTYRTRTDLR